MSESKERTLDEINEILHLAKLNENEIQPVSQTLYFTSENLYNNNYRLLELNSNLLKEVEKGQTLYIKGRDDDNVVLCSDKQTYDVHVAETSNNLLLVNNLKFANDIENVAERNINKVTIRSIFSEYLEATITKPRLGYLRELLNKSVYKGPEFEYEINENDLYSFEDLTNLIQSSNYELKIALNSMNILTINNKIRLLDFEYHFRILSYMLNLIEENCWNLDEIDYEETMNAIKDLAPNEVLNCLFDKYSEESKIIDGLQLYRYKESEICKFFAQVLLYNAGRFNLDEFLQAWKESVPEGMVPNEDLLYEIAVIDRKSKPNVIRAFSEEKLPENIGERFKVLFETKEKWSVPEIAPYINRLTTDKLDVNALLAKYARVSNVDGVKYYSAKHAK